MRQNKNLNIKILHINIENNHVSVNSFMKTHSSDWRRNSVVFVLGFFLVMQLRWPDAAIAYLFTAIVNANYEALADQMARL